MCGSFLLAVTSGEQASEGISGGALGWIIFVVVTVGSIFFEISPIKINPISWLGEVFFKPVNEKIDSLQESIDKIINDQDKYRFSTIRWEILSFRNDINNGILFTINDYHHIFDNYKEYEDLHDKYGFSNGYIEDAIKDIRAHYDENKTSNSKYF